MGFSFQAVCLLSGIWQEISYTGNICIGPFVYFILCIFNLLRKIRFGGNSAAQAVSHHPNTVLLPFFQPAVITLLLEKIPEFFFDM